MANVEIKVADNGPLIVNGDIDLVDMDGNKFKTKQRVSLCRCGKSGKIPFCDGTHKNTFESRVRAKDLD